MEKNGKMSIKNICAFLGHSNLNYIASEANLLLCNQYFQNCSNSENKGLIVADVKGRNLLKPENEIWLIEIYLKL